MSTIATTQATEPPNLLEWVPAPLYRMSLERYEEMVNSGAFTERDRLHLINGFLVAKMTQGDLHCVADDLCRNALAAVLPIGWFVRSNKPVRLPPNSKPEPDHAVARGEIRDYIRRSPEPRDIAMIVEVAVTSLAEDRLQGGLYAAAGIPVYWIVNLVDHQVEVYTEPSAGGYGRQGVYKPGEYVPIVIDGAEVGRVAVSEILP